MSRTSTAKRSLQTTVWLFFALFIFFVGNAILRPTPAERLVLPNGSIVYRPFFIFPYWPIPDLYAKDGNTLLAKDIEFFCFNDNFVKVSSYDRKYSGLYGASAKFDLPNLDYYDELEISGLGGNRKSCNGYYTGMIGPGMLFVGNEWPFLPPCEWRNFENLSLQDRSWFDRPCADKLPPRYYSSNPATTR